MADFVAEKNEYKFVRCETPERTLYVFDCLLECISPEDTMKEFEVNGLYTAKKLGEFIGGSIPGATLTALVKRGLIHCDGKMNGLNYYAITDEIYDYYINTYSPGKKAYEQRKTFNFE